MTPGVDFTNILREAFTFADPKSAKNTDNLSGFLHLKAALKVLVALTSVIQNFILAGSGTDSDLVKELFRCCEEGKEWGNVFENGCDNFPVPVKNVSAKNQVIQSVS
jgi:hypothetical protein